MTFQKGQSGNPAGRRPDRDIKKLREAMKMLVPHAVKTVYDVMMNAEQASTRLKAAQDVLDRYYGKPIATIELEHGSEPIKLNAQMLHALPDHMLSQLAEILKTVRQIDVNEPQGVIDATSNLLLIDPANDPTNKK